MIEINEQWLQPEFFIKGWMQRIKFFLSSGQVLRVDIHSFGSDFGVALPVCIQSRASKPQNHIVDNLILMTIVGLVFLVWGSLQLKSWHSQRHIWYVAGR